MEIDQFRKFLTALRDVGCELTGSFASGKEDTQYHVSDIDLVCPDKVEDDFGNLVQNPIDDCINIFERFGVPWDSAIVGSIGSPRDLETLPRPVEVMEESWALIKPTFPVDESVSVCGVEFKTWQPPKEKIL